MTSNLDILIEKAFENADSYIPYEEKNKKHHFFSLCHKKNISKISDEFFSTKEPFDEYSAKSKFRVRVAFICTLVILAILLTGFIGYKHIAGTHANEYDGYALLTHANTNNSVTNPPMKKFKINGINKNDYTVITQNDSKSYKSQLFKNKKTNNVVIVTQIQNPSYVVTRVSTDGCETVLSSVIIDNKEYLYILYEDGECVYTRTEGNCEMTYRGNNQQEVLSFIKATVIT